MNIKKTLKKHAAPVILATAISGSVMVANSVTAKADEVEEVSESIVMEEGPHSEVVGILTPSQSIVREAVISTSNVETKTTSEEKTLVSNEFDTKEEAQEWIDKRTDILEEAYEITKEEIITSTVKEQVGDAINIDEEFSNEEDALDKKEELESDTSNKCDLIVEEETETHKTETVVNVDEIFDTEEEQDAYIESIEDKKDLTLTEEVISDVVSHPEEKVAEINKDTKEELDNEIDSIISDIKASETDDVTYETRVEESTKEESVLVGTKEDTISGTFDTKEEAEAFIEGKKGETTENVTYEFDEITERTESNREESNINEVVDSREEVESYIDNLESQGYNILNYDVSDESTTEIEKIPTGNVVVKDSVKYPSNSHFEANGNFAIIKQGNGTAVVWTSEPLSESEKTSFKDSFLANDLDPSIRDSKFEYISGTGTYDLSYIGTNWGTYLVNYNEGVITVECDKDRISHLNIGTIENEVIEETKVVPKFRIVGKKYIEENYNVYDVNGIVKEQLYENKTTYHATIYKTLKENNKKYKLTGSYIEEKGEISKKYTLKGTVIKYVEKEKYKGLISYKRVIPEKEEKPEDESKKETYVWEEKNGDIPKTSDDNNIGLYSAMLLSSTLGLGLTAGYAVESEKVKKKKMNKTFR